jgi:allophanate hydrolase
VTAVDRVALALDRIERSATDRSEVWIHRRDPADVLADAAEVDRRAEPGPLAGWTVAVKDNIDVAGTPTTAGCPAFAFEPDASAPVVERLQRAGAVVVGKTNMDQFATGLVGTRSPYGAVRNAVDPAFVAGGSSSGSAVAVALGLVDLALGTDTAGSGRVPAACNGIVGLKPTHGRLSTRGVVAACPSFDCVSVFAPTVHEAAVAVDVMAGFDPADPMSRAAPVAASRTVTTVGVVRDAADHLDATTRTAWAAAIARLRQLGHQVVDVDDDLFDRAGALLYGGFVAERYAAVGAFVDQHLDACDSTVAQIISTAGRVPAHTLAADHLERARLRRRAAQLFDTVDAVVMPTTPRVPRLEEVAADRIGVNASMGRFSYACNVLDLSAVAVPAGEGDGGLPFGISLFGPAFADRAIAGLGASFLGATEPVDDAELEPTCNATPAECGDRFHDLVVVGAHLAGQPLNVQLTELGGQLVAATTTADAYRLYALATDPPKPGLVREPTAGRAIKVEIWRLPAPAFATFVANVPPPLAIGAIELVDGRWLPGFTCTPEPLAAATDITAFGGWRAFVSR